MTARARAVPHSFPATHPPSGNCHSLTQVYPPQTAVGHRGKAQAPGLRAGQTCGVSHLWSPLQGWQRWIFRKPTLLPHFLSLFTKKPATIRKISQAVSMASVSAASQGLPCGQDACLQPFVLLRSPGPLSLADAVCTGCSVTELIGGKRRRGKAR